MSNTYLVHYGILGQKWGKRNGPPYPLNASDKSYAERKAGNNIKAKDVKKNMDYLTDAELQKAINRINMQRQVNSLSKQDSIIKIGRDKVMKDIRDFSSSYNDVTGAYNIIKRISAVFSFM